MRIAAWATCLGLISVLTACASGQHAVSGNGSLTTAAAASTPAAQTTAVAASTPAAHTTAAAASTPATPLPSADYRGTGTAHGCAPQKGPIITLTVNPDGIAPSLGCVQIGGKQHLRIVNNTNGFGYQGQTIKMSVRGLPTATIPRATAWTYPEAISGRLAVGQHFGTCTCGPGEPWGFVIWVI